MIDYAYIFFNRCVDMVYYWFNFSVDSIYIDGEVNFGDLLKIPFYSFAGLITLLALIMTLFEQNKIDIDFDRIVWRRKNNE